MSSRRRKTLEIKPIPGQRVPSFADEFVNEETMNRLRHIVAPHVDSFNYFLEHGLGEAVLDMAPMEFQLQDGPLVRLSYTSAEVAYPLKKDDLVSDTRLTPREARERGISYSGSLLSAVSIDVEGEVEGLSIPCRMGDLPIMVMSERCHLKGLDHIQLIRMKEEANECGGYFIMNGIERVIRLLQVPRRNYATAIERNSYRNRGPSYSDKGVAMRCVRRDQSSVTMTLHYLANGGATMRFVLRKQEFLLPVVIVAKALLNITDKELFDRVVQGDRENTFMTTRLELLLRDAKQYNIYSRAECQAFLGSHFRIFLPLSDRTTDEEAGRMLIDRYFFVHVDDYGAKLECLLHMLRKLFSFAEGKCASDNADALMNHELLLPGHLITMYVKEKMEEVLLNIKTTIIRDYRTDKVKCLSNLRTAKYFQRYFDRFGSNIGQKIGSFLSTGNVVSSTGMDLMQVSGYTIVAERLNIFRYLSHFQSVHRGQFFTTMKTTTVRKLLPESWGFLCPVHTPDGGPCGLLNHAARDAVTIAFHPRDKLPTTTTGTLKAPEGPDGSDDWITDTAFKRLLVSMGVVSAGAGGGDGQLILSTEYIPVLIDGVVLGGMKSKDAANIVKQLRYMKVSGGAGDKSTRLDPTMEIAYIPYNPLGGAYPGVYIFTEPGRMIRPVLHLGTRKTEWIGPMEQVFMDIACVSDDVRPETTHMELNPGTMLSQIASLTPFSDYNQSPRNMYQCQMGKQTMGTPAHALRYRPDNKLYRIQNPQAPLVQTQTHRDYCMDEYPNGTNAVVAVISYTGFDMEDAMIISKSSFQRGFGHGFVYKTKEIDLDEEEKHTNKSGVKPQLIFDNRKVLAAGSDNVDKFCPDLDWDGLPFEGVEVNYGSPICCLVDRITNEHRLISHKEHEKAFVTTVRVLGPNKASPAAKDTKASQLRRISITFRFPRQPVIGDKFSSRHGQKGTLSVLWPQENMPFSESGMSPDVLINPHAFPSRMTIGMLIESMAGKAGAMHGIFQDSTPFQFHEERKVIDYFGEQLRACGYHYYGSEPLYNGISGKVMQADIFMGVVFYQRLRHMVSDKSQVRSTGPVVALTRQPVKGRKKGGGIRLGEMERDALLSHGVAFCLLDRLMNCSDWHLAHVCGTCGGLISVYPQQQPNSGSAGGVRRTRTEYCSICKSAAGVRPVNLPYVYRYLTNELAAMGIKLSLKLSE